MVDQFGRTIRYLRLSVTDRCDLRCRYCMPERGVAWAPHSAILTYEQLIRLVRIGAGLGIDRVRLTGGEPLVRRDLHVLVRALKGIDGIRTVTLTTNGVLLAQQLPALRAAGLDTLNRGQYAAITRRDKLLEALAGLEAALSAPGLTVKLNCVPLEENEDQWVPLAALAREGGLDVRFIELMPIGLGKELAGRAQAEVLSALEKAFGPARPCGQGGGGGPARYVTFDGFIGRVGFISAVSHKFCADCNRVRLTASGFLKTCLQYDEGVDLKPLLEAGADDGALRSAMEGAIFAKPACHHFTAAPTAADEGRNMNQIGG